MAILCSRDTRLLIHGLGRMGRFHAKISIEYGTQVVGGVAPGKGGSVVDGMDVVDKMEAVGSQSGRTAAPVVIKDCGELK